MISISPPQNYLKSTDFNIMTKDVSEQFSELSNKLIPYFDLDESEILDSSTEEVQNKIREIIASLKEILPEISSNWAAEWMLGKAYQTLKEHETSYEYFLSSHKKILTDTSVLRELALECIYTKRYANSVYYCQSAIEFSPDDHSLWPNMALAKLFDGKLDDAEKWINKSLDRIPEDVPTQNIARLIQEVKEKKREIPTDLLTLEKEEWTKK